MGGAPPNEGREGHEGHDEEDEGHGHEGDTDEGAHEYRTALAKARTGVTPTEAMETMALTIAHRLQEFQATHRGDEPENEKAD